MSVTRKFLIAPALVLAVAATPLHARPTAPSRDAGSTAALEEAERLVASGQFRAAGREFKLVADRMKAAGKSPLVALRGIATVAYLRGDDRAAVEALDDVAAAAAEYGDPEARVNALLDAALLYQGLHDARAVNDHVVSIRHLLESPVLSEATRDAVSSRIVGK